MLGECLTELAKKYPQSKFVKIISTECIPNYPDKNVPTVLIYKDTKCLQHIIGLASFGGPRTTPERESTAVVVPKVQKHSCHQVCNGMRGRLPGSYGLLLVEHVFGCAHSVACQVH